MSKKIKEINDDNDNEAGIAKWIPTIVLLVAVAGFASLAWYSYKVGRESVKEEDLLVIEADDAPIKEKPLDAGGMQFPNQDKTVFETFSSNQQPAKVERVLPVPEEPITNNEEMEKAIEQNVHKPAAEKIATEEKSAEVKRAESLVFYNKKDDETKITDRISVKKDEVEKTPVKAPAKTSGQKVQLGAYGSEKEAQGVWTKLQKKISILADKSPIIVRADVQGKGVFYRLRVSGFACKDDAKAFCKTLSASGQACILVSE